MTVSPPRSPRSAAARGFTMTELLVSLVVTSIVCAGALALLTSQQRAFQLTAADRALQETARTALQELSTNLRRAGYGIEPWLAFDFGPVTNAPPSWSGGPVLTTAGYPGGPPAGPPVCNPTVTVTNRDRVDGPDEVVFYARDPAFSRKLSAAPSASTLTVTPGLATPLYRGQILQVMCAGAASWAYVTVAAQAAAGATSVQLQTTCSGTFPYQQSLLTTGCFAAGSANVRVFKVDRFHYYVQRFADPDVGQRPYLMVDRGLLNDDGTPLAEPVAPDVEDLQLAYVFPSSTPSLVGSTAGTQLTNAANGIDLGAVPPAYTDPTGSTARITNHPANIRAVRVGIVVRSSTPDINTRDATSATIPAAANRGDVPGDANYRRLQVETTEAVRNLDSRAPYSPAYSTNNGADGLNVGGG